LNWPKTLWSARNLKTAKYKSCSRELSESLNGAPLDYNKKERNIGAVAPENLKNVGLTPKLLPFFQTSAMLLYYCRPFIAFI